MLAAASIPPHRSGKVEGELRERMEKYFQFCYQIVWSHSASTIILETDTLLQMRSKFSNQRLGRASCSPGIV
jgi:hypothetical protein